MSSNIVQAGRRLDLASWLIAFDRYALAAAATNQMSFQACMNHKNVVVDVAMSALAEKRRNVLGVIYDEVAR